MAVVEVEVAVAEVPPPPPLVQVASAAAPSVVETTLAVAATSDLGVASSSQGFLNMGKWEAPVEAERSAFQFGSFGVNAYGEDDGVNGGVSASQVGTNPSAAPWTGLHSTEEKVVSNVWGTAGADQSLDMSSGLFAQQSSTTSKALETAPDAGNVAATRAPPGLGQNKPNANASNNASRSTVGQIKNNKTEIASAQNQAQQTQLPAYQQQQQSYNQGVPPGMNNRNAPVLNPLAGGLPYAYNPSFDLAQQAQFSGYPIGGGLVPPTAPAAAAASAAAPVSTSSAAATSAAAPATGVAQQQQQPYPAAPFPFYPNPYYPSQAYYYGQPQMPNYYGHGQGRDMYQQRGNPYGGNPYGNAGSLYPGDVYGQQAAGQFPDAAGNYGGVHPGAANTGSSAGNNSNKTAKNSANPAGAVGAGAGTPGMTPEQHSANLLMNSGYGYVNPYNARGPMDGQGWQGYPGNQAAAWGAPMMFPNNSSPTNLSGSAQQQGQAQQQSQQQQGGNRGANSGYANNSFGGRGNGAGCAPSAGTGVSTQGSW